SALRAVACQRKQLPINRNRRFGQDPCRALQRCAGLLRPSQCAVASAEPQRRFSCPAVVSVESAPELVRLFQVRQRRRRVAANHRQSPPRNQRIRLPGRRVAKLRPKDRQRLIQVFLRAGVVLQLQSIEPSFHQNFRALKLGAQTRPNCFERALLQLCCCKRIAAEPRRESQLVERGAETAV